MARKNKTIPSFLFLGCWFMSSSFAYSEEEVSVRFYKEIGLSDSLAQVEYERYRERLCLKKASELVSLSELESLEGFSEEEKKLIEVRFKVLNPLYHRK